MFSWDELLSQYCHRIAKTNPINLSEEFSQQTADKKVSFAYKLLKVDNIFPTFFKSSEKSIGQASVYRKHANQLYIRRKDREAIAMYTKCITVSPDDCEEISLAYANRSAVLFRLGSYSSCLSDIHNALKSKYPESKKEKLLQREEKCMEKLKKSQHNTEVESTVGADWREIPNIECPNQFLCCASNKVKIQWSVEMGRFLNAAEDLLPGEVLAIENAYASILLPPFLMSHCSYCFIRTESSIPCTSCSNVVFCSADCFNKAYDSFHKIECIILHYLLELKFGKMELLALRILLIATSQGENLNPLLSDITYKYPLTTERISFVNTVYPSNDYESVHHLADNFEKRTTIDLFRRSGAAAFMLYALKNSNFFSNINKAHSPGDELTYEESYVGTLLLKYLLIVVSNAHEISEFVETRSCEKTISSESVEIGAALYPLLSLINHSCDPNVVRHSYGNKVVLRSIQPVSKGSQLFDNYGYHFAAHPREYRRKRLEEQYYFNCLCEACNMEWPIFQELPDNGFDLISEVIDKKKLEMYTKKYMKYLSDFPRYASKDVINCLLEYLSLLHISVKKPCRYYSGCQEMIKQIMAYKANNYMLTVNQ